MGLPNLGGPIAQSQRNRCSISPVEVIFAGGVRTDITIRNYRYHMKNMSNYFDAEKPFDEVTKRDIEAKVVAMRKAGLAHNTIATYNRMLKTFYNWCNAEEFYG